MIVIIALGHEFSDKTRDRVRHSMAEKYHEIENYAKKITKKLIEILKCFTTYLPPNLCHCSTKDYRMMCINIIRDFNSTI